jgi:hypothetical protein
MGILSSPFISNTDPRSREKEKIVSKQEEFENFAESKDLKSENGQVAFGQDGDAAEKFRNEA